MAPVPGSTDKPFRARWLKNGANILLLGLKVLNVYSHWAINDEFERTAPSLVFFLLLRYWRYLNHILKQFVQYNYEFIIFHLFFFLGINSCRLVVDWQLSRHDTGKQENKEPVQVPSTGDKFDQVDDNDSSDQETSYIKTRSGRSAKMSQKKDQ